MNCFIQVLVLLVAASAQAQMPSKIMGRGMIDGDTRSTYLGLECVGGDEKQSEKSCWFVQPVVIDLNTQTVLERGKILQVEYLLEGDGDFDPSSKAIHRFFRDLNQDYLHYLSDHRSKRQKNSEDAFAGGGAITFGAGGLYLAKQDGLHPENRTTTTIEAAALAFGVFLGVNWLAKRSLGFKRHGEVIDAKGWNWATHAKRVKSRQFYRFKKFLMSY